MAKTLYERRAETEEKIRQLENQQKQLIQKEKVAERKARTRRLIERGAIVESLLDDAKAFTNEEVKTILTAALKSGAAIDAMLSIKNRQGTTEATERTVYRNKNRPALYGEIIHIHPPPYRPMLTN